MIKRKFRFVLKTAVALVFGVALYNEWIVYLIQPYHWNMPQCRWSGSNCTKMLFIADPQIQGEDRTRIPQRYLYNWDSDRYLRLTFKEAVKHFKPDILVFLGDMMDEGSTATSEQFDGYVKRLMSIFATNYPVYQIWIPGDNDIGGEFEPIKLERVYQFNKAFSQPEVVTYNNITFFVVNKVMYRIPKYVDKDDGNLRVALSHYTLTYGTEFDMKTYQNIRPDISFCGHEHKSRYKSMTSEYANIKNRRYKAGDDVLKLALDGMFYEIFVPTCSYRMGTSFIGYGAAVIGNNNQNMEYSVLWSPERFPYLYRYVVIGCGLLFCFLLWMLVKLLGYRSNITNYYSRLSNLS